MAYGEISAVEFREQALELVELLHPSGLGWAWIEPDDRPGYLRAHISVPAPDACTHCAGASDRGAQLECANDANTLKAEAADACITRACSVGKATHQLQYHVALHPTFCQPTLLILGQHCDGAALRTTEVWAHVSTDIQAHRDSPFVLTEVEHPSIGVPCFALHPCRTDDLISLMRATPMELSCSVQHCSLAVSTKQRVSYLATWWSAVAPLVNLPNRLSWYYPTDGDAA